MVVLTVGAFIFWDVIGDFVSRAPGDFHTDTGSNRLNDRLYEEALEEFNLALEQAPDHRGALMGRALVYIQSERYDEAIAELTYLIGVLERTLEAEPDDVTGRGVMAAAYANRGIVHDRQGRYQQALDDYIAGLKTDLETVEGPDIFHKILYGGDHLSTVQERAQYLYEQLQLPEEERLMRVPELDAQQRMYKP
jgi:tetratricopeptide (TPR) repeat protein